MATNEDVVQLLRDVIPPGERLEQLLCSFLAGELLITDLIVELAALK